MGEGREPAREPAGAPEGPRGPRLSWQAVTGALAVPAGLAASLAFLGLSLIVIGDVMGEIVFLMAFFMWIVSVMGGTQSIVALVSIRRDPARRRGRRWAVCGIVTAAVFILLIPPAYMIWALARLPC